MTINIFKKKTIMVLVLSGMCSGVAYNSGMPVWEETITEVFKHESLKQSLAALVSPHELPFLAAKLKKPDMLLKLFPSKAKGTDSLHHATPQRVSPNVLYFKMTRGPQRRAARIRNIRNYYLSIGEPGRFHNLL